MPLFFDRRCQDEKEGNYFYVIRLRATTRLLLCCEACESRWSHPEMDPERDRVATSPYESLAPEEWEYADWADLDRVGWNKDGFRRSRWRHLDEPR